MRFFHQNSLFQIEKLRILHLKKLQNEYHIIVKMKYYIQILDEISDEIVYFDRIKSSYGIHRIITSKTPVKFYIDEEQARNDVNRIIEFYSTNCLVEIVEYIEKQ